MHKKDDSFTKQIVLSLMFTLVIAMLFMFIVPSLLSIPFKNASVEQSNYWIIACMFMGVIFTLFICTFTILDEINKKGE